MSNTKSISRIFSKIDLLGQEFNFESDNSIRHRSSQGALFSLITIIAIVIIAFLFGQEVYQRKNPNISLSKEVIPYSQVYLKDFPLLFTFHYPDTSEVKNITDVFDFSIETYHINSQSQVSALFNYTLVPCTQQVDKFRYNKQYVVSALTLTNYDYYCINFDDNYFFQNPMATTNSTFLKIIISICKEEERDSCNLKRYDILNYNLQLVLTFVDNYVNSMDYSNPVVSYLNRKVQYLSYDLFKIANMIINNDILTSDNGWLFEELNQVEYMYFSDYINESNLRVKGETKIFALVLESPIIRNKATRNYLKVQELFARIGGIANAMFIIVYFICYDYLRFIYLLFIREHTFKMIDKEFLIGKQEKNNKVSKFTENFSNYFKNNNLISHISSLNNQTSYNNINNIDNNHGNINDNYFTIHNNQRKSLSNNMQLNEINEMIDNKSNSKLDESCYANKNSGSIKVKKILSSNSLIKKSFVNSNSSVMRLDLNKSSSNNVSSMNAKKDNYESNLSPNYNLNNVSSYVNKNNMVSGLHNKNSSNKINYVNSINNANIININNNVNNLSNSAYKNKLSVLRKDKEENKNKDNSVKNIFAIKQFKEDISDILRIDNSRTFKEGEKITYYNYLRSNYFSCFINQDLKDKYLFEITRIKKLLDIKTFKHFLMEAYSLHYTQA